MKRLRQILLAVIVSTALISCDKDDVNEDDDMNQEPIKKETISGKWNVDGQSKYKSFEFNESGNFIVVENLEKQSVRSSSSDNPMTEERVYFGTYEVTDRTVLLVGLGRIKVSTLKSNSIKFSLYFTSDPDNEIVLNATKQEEMESTSKTNLLCRTWKSVTLNGKDVAGTENDGTVIFSNAGTYLTDNSEGLAMARWKWKNEGEGLLNYAWLWTGTPVWNDNEVRVLELTATHLKIIEKFDYMEDELWVFKAMINPKSSSSNSEIKKPTVGKRKGVSLLRQ